MAQRGLLDADGIVKPTDPDAPTGDPVLDGLLELVEESRPRTWKTWISPRARVTLDAVRVQLAADGYPRAEQTRVLGLFPFVEYEVDRVAVVDGLREEARQVLEGPVPVDEVSERDAALVALTAGGELCTLLSGKEQRQYKGRVDALAERSGAATPALKKAVQEVRTALAVAMTTTAATGS